MAQGFTDEQIAQLAQLIGGALDARLGSQVAVAPAAPVATESQVVVLGTAESKSARKARYTGEEIAAQRAADLSDSLRNAYTPLARNRIVGEYDSAAWVPVWTAERDRLVAGGMAKHAANKQARVNVDTLRDIETARLKTRDGLKSGQVPVVDADKIRSIGAHSDPTANVAIANVDRESRRAELQRQIAALDQAESQAAIMAAVATPPAPKVRSAASVAQAAIGANPRERWVDKLVSDAKASGNAAGFLQNWVKDRKIRYPNSFKNSAQIARVACERLGIATK